MSPQLELESGSLVIRGGTGSIADSSRQLTLVTEASTQIMSKASVLQTLLNCSQETGGYVQLIPENNFLPALIDIDNKPIFLYQIVEAIDEFIDYDELQEEYPTLTHSQIMGAVAFLRKIAQINSQNVDIDELEDEADANDPELLEAIRLAIHDTEVACVFPDPKQDK